MLKENIRLHRSCYTLDANRHRKDSVFARLAYIIFESSRQVQKSISVMIKDNLLYENRGLDVKNLKIIKSLAEKTTEVRARHP